MVKRIVTVFGGSGFVGRHLVRHLTADGATVRVAVRDPEDARYLKIMGDVGQIVPFAADVRNEATLAAAVEGAESVVNLVGILSEWRAQNFANVHTQGAANVAKAAAAADVARLVQISAIGANEKSGARYAQTKAAGEAAIYAEFPNATIIRPSVIFGPEDHFFNFFAGLARFTWVMPVFGCPVIPILKWFTDDAILNIDFYGDGGTKFQPVYVDDVAAAIVSALAAEDAPGKTYELGGPSVYSSVDIMRMLTKIIGRKRLLVPIPFWYLAIWGWLLQKIPAPLLTYDQVKQLEADNVVSEGAKTLADLGVMATPAEAILPGYLSRFKKVGHEAASST
ncbi:MAG: complex I NDUFA9 subunit family protein [Rhodospirillales bacterium]|nr:complex I NDUFA9 subunit family protein [Rhodospirillales bacterium]